jgi:hypothetical protein
MSPSRWLLPLPAWGTEAKNVRFHCSIHRIHSSQNISTINSGGKRNMIAFIFLDNEQTELTATDLVKIGLVTGDFWEFYMNRHDFNDKKCRTFVHKEILPILGQSPEALTRAAQLEIRLKEWVSQSSGNARVVAFNYVPDKNAKPIGRYPLH